MKHAKILSIVGFGGLGKTTLENEVYRRIKGHFQCHTVSQKPDVKTIIKDMISQITSCEERFQRRY
jgi:molybdopterin-guanine dinucleotide biosynthesis protein